MPDDAGEAVGIDAVAPTRRGNDAVAEVSDAMGRSEELARPRTFDPSQPGRSERYWAPTLAALEPPWWASADPGTLVVVAPHPDDETLGVGGTLHELSAHGWRVVIVAVTDGEASQGRQDPARVAWLRSIRPLEQRLAVSALTRAVEIVRLGFDDGRVARSMHALVDALATIVGEASLVLSTWHQDGHPDHEAVGTAARRAAARAGVRFAEFPIWGWHWARRADLPRRQLRGWRLSPDSLNAKRRALEAFASQTSGTDGAPVLPAHVLTRFLRPVEAFLV